MIDTALVQSTEERARNNLYIASDRYNLIDVSGQGQWPREIRW